MTAPHDPATEPLHHGHDHHDETKVIQAGRGQALLSIFEEGVPPRFRIHFLDAAGQPTTRPDSVVTVETIREGGGRQQFVFQPQPGGYLEATEILPEPHEFGAVLTLAHGEHAHSYEVQFVEHDHATADHGHDHGPGGHTHGPGADHSHGNTFSEAIHHLLPWLPGGHRHSHVQANIDSALETNADGIRAVKQSLIVLGLTFLAQAILVVLTGSVALLADTIHNLGDALTAVPLWIAFSLARRAPSKRFTYGLARSEDLAGIMVVLLIFFSAAVALYEAVDRIIHPQVISSVAVVFAAGILGFLGNEWVSVIRTRAGKRIGSAALVADGQHALIDGYTSLAVAAGAVGVWIGFPLADPIVGIFISIAILFIVKDAAISIFRRAMDGIEPEKVDEITRVARAVPGIEEVNSVRARWQGHTIAVDLLVTVDEDLTTRQSHAILEKVRRDLFHEVGMVGSIMIHADPTSRDGTDHHRSTAHHEPTLYGDRARASTPARAAT
jgi:cation diffusion facilitator family transporter